MSLPDILKVKPMNTVDTMSIHTSILEPIVCNQNVCRFTLERRGILDVNSVLQVGAVFQKMLVTLQKNIFLPLDLEAMRLLKPLLFV